MAYFLACLSIALLFSVTFVEMAFQYHPSFWLVVANGCCFSQALEWWKLALAIWRVGRE